MTDSILVFTVATNGYSWLYKRNIKTHKNYADNNNYVYAAVDRPKLCTLGIETAWLKMTLIRDALEAGYEWILFLDADTEIRIDAPPITSLEQPEKSIYVANGYSGRINSGVLIIKNTSVSKKFINNVLEIMEMPIPREDSVGWGENGHIIHLAKNETCIHLISNQWNNNSDIKLKDYIRHYSAGPMRKLYKPGHLNLTIFLVYHYILAVIKRLKKTERLAGICQKSFRSRLESLTRRTLIDFPIFENRQLPK